ncbi:hypothetical protein LZZ85_24340 [Terrimonas sp. NA20]|uniref:Uncharacterized protein n=1 Tax=Terrimonas ginsenosidimutans TaxID=2908004 RepID=A0ABS9KYQ3_9BACT|nr:hypothetical protein [Terrimonas ginsenosidimutans]MCG2617450.1 hypothetical protein [Terrimonas ginsenosidimutans]
MKVIVLSIFLLLFAIACNPDVSSMSIKMNFSAANDRSIPVLYFVRGNTDSTTLANAVVLQVNGDIFEEVHNILKAKLSEPTLYEEQENVVTDESGEPSAAYSVTDPAMAVIVIDDIIELLQEKKYSSGLVELEKVKDLLK